MEEVGVIFERRLTSQDVRDRLEAAALIVSEWDVALGELFVRQPARDDLDLRITLYTTTSDSESLDRYAGSPEIFGQICIRTIASLNFVDRDPAIDSLVNAVIAALTRGEHSFVECSGAFWPPDRAVEQTGEDHASPWRQHLNKLGSVALQRALEMLPTERPPRK